MRPFLSLLLISLFANVTLAQTQPTEKPDKNPPPTEEKTKRDQDKETEEPPFEDEATAEVYKRASDTELLIYRFDPPGYDADNDTRPAAVFFFGGGWNGGSVTQFEQHAKYLASRGMVTFVADYRVKSRQKVTPDACVADAKSAVRWIRTHAERLGIDPERIAAGGGSAGGHIAAAAGMCDGLDDPAEADSTISSKPNALLLFNPVYHNGPGGFAPGRVAKWFPAISPAHNISEDDPPTIVFLGSEDKLVSKKIGRKFDRDLKAVGVRSEFHLYEGQPHGFFNEGKSPESFLDTVLKMDTFLVSLEWLEGKADREMLESLLRGESEEKKRPDSDKKANLNQEKETEESPFGDEATAEVYKRASDTELLIYRFDPPSYDADNDSRPAAVFFFGGSWNRGTVTQFEQQAKYLASRCMVTFVADYRVKSRQNVTPDACVADAKSAVRWVRTHAERLGIDPERIAAGGGSAGGHIAAAAGMCDSLDDPTEADSTISSKPNALLLFNPVYHNGPEGGFSPERVAEWFPAISPAHNISEDDPPTIVFLGTEDEFVSVEVGQKFDRDLKAVGVRSELHLYEGQPHAFFNEGKSPESFMDTVLKMDAFLVSLKWIEGDADEEMLRSLLRGKKKKKKKKKK